MDRAEKLRAMEAMLHAAIKIALELELHDIAARLSELQHSLRRSSDN